MEKAVLKTICYHAVFHYPLTPTEIWLHLIGPTDPTWRRRDLTPILTSLIKKNLLVSYRNYYTVNSHLLPQNPIKTLIVTRQVRRKISRAKLALAYKKTDFLTHLPGICLVAVTGSLAVSQAQPDDDIDLLIVTSSGRLWQTRLTTTLVSDLLGRRRRPTDSIVTDKLCLNFYLDASNLTITAKKQNLYTAYELTTLLPLYDRADHYSCLMLANSWVNKYQPHAYQTKTKQLIPTKPDSPTLPSVLENLAHSLQTRYMSRRRTSELITPHQLYFHPYDNGTYIMREYKQIYGRIL